MKTAQLPLPTLRDALKKLYPSERNDLLQLMEVNELELQHIEQYPLSCTIKEATACMAYMEPRIGHHSVTRLFC